MDGVEISRVISKSLFEGFIQVFQIMWTIDEFKSAIIGIPISVITFKIVGSIFRWGRSNDIWFGSIGGKVLHYLVNTFLIWVVVKVV
jgi:hypothetical protein